VISFAPVPLIVCKEIGADDQKNVASLNSLVVQVTDSGPIQLEILGLRTPGIMSSNPSQDPTTNMP
jgi:hypothetical protein